MNAPTQYIPLENTSNIELYVKREDLLHPFISGNKFRKLKYNIEEAKRLSHSTILTFGGAFSNHIAATAYASKLNGFKSVGIIRGEELETKVEENATLRLAREHGMQFYFVSRKDYRKKESRAFQTILKAKFGKFYLVPEGGTNDLAVKGCEEILDNTTKEFDYICTCVGTGGTISGLINASEEYQKILGFSALKGDFLKEDIRKFAKRKNWDVITDYHFGGYAKINTELVTFINRFKADFGLALDPVYTGKLFYGLIDMISKQKFENGSKILAIHTGGLQGIAGMNKRLKQNSMPLIEIE